MFSPSVCVVLGSPNSFIFVSHALFLSAVFSRVPASRICIAVAFSDKHCWLNLFVLVLRLSDD